MNDVFGNYVIQKVLELGPDDHREELAQQMKGQVRRQGGPTGAGGGGGGGAARAARAAAVSPVHPRHGLD
jgi:hypothetical protein